MGNASLAMVGWVMAVVFGGLGVAGLLMMFAPNTRRHTALCLAVAAAFSLALALIGRG
jgi:hypothetical protein